MNNKNESNGKAPAAGAPVLKPETKSAEASKSSVSENGQLNGIEKQEQPLTVADRIAKLNQLNELVEQYEKLKSHQLRVESMKFGVLDEHSTVTISSQGGNAYTIKNPYLVEKIAKMLKEEFSQKIKETEALIAF